MGLGTGAAVSVCLVLTAQWPRSLLSGGVRLQQGGSGEVRAGLLAGRTCGSAARHSGRVCHQSLKSSYESNTQRLTDWD